MVYACWILGLSLVFAIFNTLWYNSVVPREENMHASTLEISRVGKNTCEREILGNWEWWGASICRQGYQGPYNNYFRPQVMRPKSLLSWRHALARSIELQRRDS